MLPPQRQGGREEIIHASREGATAMMPMKGCSGTSMSLENSATLRARSNLITFGVGAVSKSGSTPVPRFELLTP